MSYQEYPNPLIIRAATKAPYLERDEEMELAIKWAEERDQEALHKLTQAHMRLVIALAFKFKRYGLPTAELIQEGHIGLLEAAARFEPEREVRFSTYATWWIRASMQDFILRNWSIVRGGTSSNQKSLFFNLRKLRAEIARNGTTSNSQEIYAQLAQALKVSVKDVANMDARFAGPDYSLNAPLGDDEEGSSQRQDFLVSDEAAPDENVTMMIDGQRENQWLYQAVDVLNAREKRIIEARRLSDDVATLDDLGKELGISKGACPPDRKQGHGKAENRSAGNESGVRELRPELIYPATSPRPVIAGYRSLTILTFGPAWGICPAVNPFRT